MSDKNSGIALIKKKFVEYYEQNLDRMKPPESIEKREFGFLLFKKGVMVRHKGFRSIDEAGSFIQMLIPSDVYYSTAYYENPQAPMSEKKWLGADLVFDIDADHLVTSCKELHDKWICETCGFSEKGMAPKKCSKCEGEKIKMESWICESCLDEAKKEVMKLVDVLISDFGLQPKDLSSYFSGHRGYHLHVNSKQTRMLEDNERREIVDYLLGIGLDLQLDKIRQSNYMEILKELKLEKFGWKGKIAKEIQYLEDIDKAPIKSKARYYKENIKRIIEENSIGIDTVVTTDTHRLIRMPESLHGKTGFRAVEVDINRIEEFDPFKEAIAWKGKESIFVLEAPKFRMGEEEYGPYEKEKVDLPTPAAILLLCKNKATLMG